jgi:hypothetical protein
VPSDALGEQREPRFLRRFAALGPLEWVNMRLEVKHGLRMALVVSEMNFDAFSGMKIRFGSEQWPWR